jgi:hypothetical protein
MKNLKEKLELEISKKKQDFLNESAKRKAKEEELEKAKKE